MSETFTHDLSENLRQMALAYPQTTEGSSCVNRAFKAGGKKTFLFVGEKDGQVRIMVKLVEQADAARALDEHGSWDVSVGGTGWCTALFPPDDHPPLDTLRAWVDESFRLLAPKKLLKAMAD